MWSRTFDLRAEPARSSYGVLQVLIDPDGNANAVRIHNDQAVRAASVLVGFLFRFYPLCLEPALYGPHILEGSQGLRLLIPAGMEGGMFPSNIPWNNPMRALPFFMIRYLPASSPPKTEKPSFS